MEEEPTAQTAAGTEIPREEATAIQAAATDIQQEAVTDVRHQEGHTATPKEGTMVAPMRDTIQKEDHTALRKTATEVTDAPITATHQKEEATADRQRAGISGLPEGEPHSARQAGQEGLTEETAETAEAARKAEASLRQEEGLSAETAPGEAMGSLPEEAQLREETDARRQGRLLQDLTHTNSTRPQRRI